MKLLLDEMWPPLVAVHLRRRGRDVVAVAERDDLRGQADPVIFETAILEQRAIVTENVADFRILARDMHGRGQDPPAMIFTTNRNFPRHDPRTKGRLVNSLDKLLSSDVEPSTLEYWLA